MSLTEFARVAARGTPTPPVKAAGDSLPIELGVEILCFLTVQLPHRPASTPAPTVHPPLVLENVATCGVPSGGVVKGGLGEGLLEVHLQCRETARHVEQHAISGGDTDAPPHGPQPLLIIGNVEEYGDVGDRCRTNWLPQWSWW